MILTNLEKVVRIRSDKKEYWQASGRVYGVLVIAEGDTRSTARTNWVLAADHSLQRRNVTMLEVG